MATRTTTTGAKRETMKPKNSSMNIELTEEQYVEMVSTIRQRHFPRISAAQAERAEAAVFLGKVTFFVQGSFTIAILVIGNEHFAGATKRNKRDRYNPILGRMLALSRAVERALHELLEAEREALGPRKIVDTDPTKTFRATITGDPFEVPIKAGTQSTIRVEQVDIAPEKAHS